MLLFIVMIWLYHAVIMVVSRSAWNCGNKQITGSGLKFHRFPLTDILLCKQWVIATKRKDFTPTKYSRLCGDHFTENDYKYTFNSRELKDNAVPTIFNFPNNLQSTKTVKRAPAKIFSVEDISFYWQKLVKIEYSNREKLMLNWKLWNIW